MDSFATLPALDIDTDTDTTVPADWEHSGCGKGVEWYCVIA